MLRTRFLTLLFLPLCLRAQEGKAALEKSVAPFLAKHCSACHNAKVKMADVNLEQLRDVSKGLAERNLWDDVLTKLRNGEMPPPGRPRPTAAEMKSVTGWIDGQLARIDKHVKPDPGRVTARRLNKSEYNNTIRDLLAVNFHPADDFPNDDAGYGFDNIGDVLTLSPVLMEKYLASAEKIAKMAIITGKPFKPALERYNADKAKADVLTGAIAVNHVFPAYAEYELTARFIDRRKDKDAPATTVVLYLDGKELKRRSFAPVAAANRIVTLRIPVLPGERKLRVVPLDVNGRPYRNVNDKQLADPSLREVFMDYVEVKGPFFDEKLGKPESHKKIFVCDDGTPECARTIVTGLAKRAWRRPVTENEINRLAGFVVEARKDGDSFEQGVQLALEAVLVSPHFLFRIERNTQAGQGTERLGPYELASRLSYFLWSSMPDDELLEVARSKQILTRDGLQAQTRRMLASPKADALVENFAGQWLQLRNLESAKPDPDIFPDFDDDLRQAMDQETRLFFANLLRGNGSILEFLDSRYSFLNTRLAKHYGIDGVEGEQFRKVEIGNGQRGGILTQASILTVSSYPTRTSPVLRGKWVLENILGTPPPPPPPDVPELNTEKIGVDETLRSQLQKHRASASCSVCHDKMDTLGFALENYDAVGVWRSKDGALPIDASGALSGKKFDDAGGLKKILAENRQASFVKNLTEKLMTYALGRGLEKYDRPEVNQICNRIAAEGHKFQSLILDIVESMPFQMRRAEGVAK